LDSIKAYGIEIPKKFEPYLRDLYPAAITVILNVKESSPFRNLFGSKLAVRVPNDAFLRGLIRKTNPLFAPSANPEGMEPAKNCGECKAYFGNRVAYCIEGNSTKLPSTIVDLSSGEPKLIRKGVAEVPFNLQKSW
jgi:L-threonylcarbamoyladenylate synthase